MPHAKANEIVEVANTLVDMRYKHHGRAGPEQNIDCVGVPIYIGHELGLSDFDTKNYGREPDLKVFNDLIRQTGCTRIPMTEMGHGDMVQISWAGASPVHVGIIEVDRFGRMWVIHAFMLHRKVTRDPVTPEMRNGFVAAWRLPE